MTLSLTPVPAAVAELEPQQARVAAAVEALRGTPGWAARPTKPEAAALHGHFVSFPAEAQWSPREVAGHLRDSAQVFCYRIARLQRGDCPWLSDFVTDERQRLEDYARTPAPDLAEDLRRCQRALLEALAGITEAQLALSGTHETDGPLTLADIVAFLPVHQAEHADQLDALRARV